MKNFLGMTAVVTGAASGIGYGLARRALELGMRVVLADIEEEALARVKNDFVDQFGNRASGVVTDVTTMDDWTKLKAETERMFGPADILFNNAGVSIPPRRTWEVTVEDWQWLVDVNLWGVIFGLRVFLPEMVRRDRGYVVNTASMAGLLPSELMAPYAATKHAVIGISETLYRDLESAESNVGVSVLCAGRVETRIFDASRNRQARYGTAPRATARSLSPGQLAVQLQPEDVGKIVFDAIYEDRFWILTHPELFGEAIRQRGISAASQENPDERSADPWITMDSAKER